MNECFNCGLCCTTTTLYVVEGYTFGKLHDINTNICNNYDVSTGKCLIYENRPKMCRDLKFNCSSCIEARNFWLKKRDPVGSLK